MSDLRCLGVTYVSGSAVESEDWAYRVVAECDHIPGCGFSVYVPEEDGHTAWGITSDDMAALHAQHLAHSERPA